MSIHCVILCPYTVSLFLLTLGPPFLSNFMPIFILGSSNLWLRTNVVGVLLFFIYFHNYLTKNCCVNDFISLWTQNIKQPLNSYYSEENFSCIKTSYLSKHWLQLSNKSYVKYWYWQVTFNLPHKYWIVNGMRLL